MKISIAQLSVLKGDVESNIAKHIKLIEAAIQNRASAIFFPELSITGYEPELALSLSMTHDEPKLDVFQKISDSNSIVIGAGLPTIGKNKPHISMAIFQPEKPRITYSKQFLHPGEEQYFSQGSRQVFIEIQGYMITPAICYESSVRQHQDHAMSNGTDIYLASVLNSKAGIDKEMKGLSSVAENNNVTVMMSNYIGESGGYRAAGRSAIWNKDGSLADQLGDNEEGVLILDTNTNLVTNTIFKTV